MRLGVVATLALWAGIGLPGSVAAQPVSDSDFLRIEPQVTAVAIDSGSAGFRVAVMVDNSTILAAISLPLTFPGLGTLDVDTSVHWPPDIQGVTYGPAGRNPAWTIKTSYVRNDLKSLLLGFISFSSFPATNDTLCYVHFAVTAGGGSAVVPLDTGEVLNQHLSFTNVYAVDCLPTWSPGQVVINFGLAGDMGCDGKVTVGDIVYLVNHLFKNGPAPCVAAAADIDCDGSFALPDVIWLINYLFRGGPRPAPPCGQG